MRPPGPPGGGAALRRRGHNPRSPGGRRARRPLRRTYQSPKIVHPAEKGPGRGRFLSPGGLLDGLPRHAGAPNRGRTPIRQNHQVHSHPTDNPSPYQAHHQKMHRRHSSHLAHAFNELSTIIATSKVTLQIGGILCPKTIDQRLCTKTNAKVLVSLSRCLLTVHHPACLHWPYLPRRFGRPSFPSNPRPCSPSRRTLFDKRWHYICPCQKTRGNISISMGDQGVT